MTSEQLFEDYDPDVEDVFGRNDQITPRRIDVTEKQKADPLRKPKVILGSILSAEKLPISVRQIEQRMMDEDGKVMNPGAYGFKTLEELLGACSDTVVRHRTRDGGFVYAAKVNEANQEIMELVQQQTDRTEARRAPRSLIRPSGSGMGTYGAAFRNRSTTKILGEDMSNRTNRGTAQQFQARNKLGPSKTAARVANLAEVLVSYRSEIGTPHSDEPGRVIVTLAALQKKFNDIYGLPAWGKLMSEPDLYTALNQPEFSSILRFWKSPDGAVVYVEEVEQQKENQEKPATAQPPAAPAAVPAPVRPLAPTTTTQRPLTAPRSYQPSFQPLAQPNRLAESTSSPLSRSFNKLNVSNPLANRTNTSTITPARPHRPDESLNSLDDFSIADSTANSNMLLEEDKSDGFFQSGPGFGGNVRQHVQSNENYSELAARFRGAPYPPPVSSSAENTTARQPSPQTTSLAAAAAVVPSAPVTPAPVPVDPLDLSQQELSFGFNSQDNSLDQQVADPSPPKVTPKVSAMRPVDSAFTAARAIIPRNPMKMLADYIKSRGAAPFHSLPEDDRVMVNFSRNVFKVYATQPGDMNVRLIDPNVDTSTLSFDGKHLREPVEADLRWMWDLGVAQVPTGRCVVKPVMFIAPRGFLLVGQAGDDVGAEESKIERMEEILCTQMHSGPLQDLDRRDVRPGMPAVYMYTEAREVHYYRVLVLGTAHCDGDVMVLLVDHDDQYCVDVKVNQLFPMPEKAGFKLYAPNVYFAALHGVQGMSETEQTIMWKNAYDDEHKSFVVAIFSAEEEKVLNVDMVWRNEFGDLQWLSQLAKRRGAIMASDTQSMRHLAKSPQSAIASYGDQFVMEFMDADPSDDGFQQPVQAEEKEEEEEEEEVIEPKDCSEDFAHHQPPLSSTPVRPPVVVAADVVVPALAPMVAEEVAAAPSPYSPTNLNVYTMYDRAIRDKNFLLLVTLSQFARALSQNLDDKEWEEAYQYMRSEAVREGIRL